MQIPPGSNSGFADHSFTVLPFWKPMAFHQNPLDPASLLTGIRDQVWKDWNRRQKRVQTTTWCKIDIWHSAKSTNLGCKKRALWKHIRIISFHINCNCQEFWSISPTQEWVIPWWILFGWKISIFLLCSRFLRVWWNRIETDLVWKIPHKKKNWTWFDFQVRFHVFGKNAFQGNKNSRVCVCWTKKLGRNCIPKKSQTPPLASPRCQCCQIITSYQVSTKALRWIVKAGNAKWLGDCIFLLVLEGQRFSSCFTS